MLSTRVIPCLLLRGAGLVKTRRFKNPVYVGDPINAIKIFNDKEVDELVLLDITASRQGSGPAWTVIEEVASECFMPLTYGGGVTSVEQVRRIFRLGVEKVVLNSALLSRPEVLRDASRDYGAQALVASIDVRRKLFGRYEVMAAGGTRSTGLDPVDHARRCEDAGAGEILLNAIERDGTMEGYDLELIAKVAAAVSIPVVAAGGAGSHADFAAAAHKGAAAVSAGAMFVFHGPHRAVLITYPPRAALEAALAPQAAA
jgi:cyclase